MKKLLIITLAFFLLQTITNAQVGINEDNSQPDASALLDVKSTDKGVLIPRMTTTQRTNISNPAQGLLVYDNTTNSFWYFSTVWTELASNGNITELSDADNDTKIQVEENADEDIIRFDIAGSQRLVLKQVNSNTLIEIPGNKNNIAIGEGAGQVNTTGQKNVMIGNNSGLNHTTGFVNTFIGHQTGESTTTGGFNTFIGAAAGSKNTTSFLNTYIGAGAGQNATGGSNVLIGVSAGLKVTGDNNIFIGNNAGRNLTNVSERLYIENSQNIPLIYGEFDNDLLRINGTLDINNAYSFPTTDGTNGQILTTNGSGTVTWTADKDNQDLTLSNNTLSLTNDNTTVDLSSFKDSKWTASGNDIHTTNSGNIGIGTANPTKAKLQIEGSVWRTINQQMGFLNPGTPTGIISNSTWYYSIYANHRVAAIEFNAFSDERIKNIKGISNSKNDLETLMQIEITDYQMKDTIDKGHAMFKKVIAQQVVNVFPQAVKNNLTDVIPDIYQQTTVKDGWIELATDLNIGDRVKIITETTNETHEVTAVEATRFKVSQLIIDNDQPTTVFIYGREVNDFHTVDYEAISMLNVSATQQLAKEVEQLKKENAELQMQVAKINQLEVMLQQLQSQLSDEVETVSAEK